MPSEQTPSNWERHGAGVPERGGSMPARWDPLQGLEDSTQRRETCLHEALLVVLQRGRTGGLLAGGLRRQAILSVYFTGSFFIIIYLKCT